MSFGHSGQGAAQHLTLLPIRGSPRCDTGRYRAHAHVRGWEIFQLQIPGNCHRHVTQAWPIRRTSEWLGLWTREGSVRVLSGQRGTVQGLWQPCAVAGVLQQHGGGTLAPPAHGSPRLSSFLRLLGPPLMFFAT